MVSINLKDIDLSVPKNRVSDEIILPKGRGRSVKIGLFGGAELAEKAKTFADLIIPPEDLETLATDKRRARKLAREYHFFIAEAGLMPVIGRRLGVFLGPKGKMPKPIPPSADPKPMIENLRSTIRVRSKDRPVIHFPVGTRGMDPNDVAENIDVALRRIIAGLERGRMNLKSVYIKTTMGKPVRLM